MRVAVTGSSGLIGAATVAALTADGHDVARLVRRPARRPDEITWDPETGAIDRLALEGVGAVVHLAGEGIGERRWTSAQRDRILASRTRGTELLATTLGGLEAPPSVLVSGSAVGYYGLRGEEILTEDSSVGDGFLADVCEQWEAATVPAADAGIRVVTVRTGIVLTSKGGALGRLLPLLRLGLAGRLGSGRQYWSWISLADEVGLIRHAIANDAVRGPMNATAPHPATNADVTAALGRAFHRPTFLAVPAFALRLALGRDLAEQVVLAGQRVLPAVALATGYDFVHPELAMAAEAVADGQ